MHNRMIELVYNYNYICDCELDENTKLHWCCMLKILPTIAMYVLCGHWKM